MSNLLTPSLNYDLLHNNYHEETVDKIEFFHNFFAVDKFFSTSSEISLT